jgi:hypothetical protein
MNGSEDKMRTRKTVESVFMSGVEYFDDDDDNDGGGGDGGF